MEKKTGNTDKFFRFYGSGLRSRIWHRKGRKLTACERLDHGGEQIMENPVEAKTLDEMTERFNTNNISFICREALKIYFRTENEETAVRALELLERAAQY